MSAERVQTDGAKAIQTGKLDVLYLLARAMQRHRGSEDHARIARWRGSDSRKKPLWDPPPAIPWEWQVTSYD